ncbi:DUF3299 domain-containing protein [Colwellia psychrerythraea]|uniref:DUF3299 domain-containing protein n=1 Tax=Colwellia psychrerythraea (strain 34H / ATCC BAA-681) TaxID=167879 RepID=Q484H1_COLP3|nr:DUF3299 domain-containing protein [Colwellia psychrerythraea]AAZ26328.1 hypothetical protein CPS_1814 [Colwellia psychrerythraea 34H]
MNSRCVLCSIILVLVVLTFSLTVRAQVEYTDIEWTELIPADDLAVLLNPPDFLFDIEDQSENDNMESLKGVSSTDAAAKRYQQALESTRIVETFDGKSIRLPGFVVPLETDEKQRVTQFFIVPYFGACLHMPPPPPNQIIFVKSSAGIEVTSLYDAFWFQGVLSIDTTDSLLGKSTYSLQLNKAYIYED